MPLWAFTFIQALKLNEQCLLFYFCGVEDFAQRHSGPLRIAHGTVAPLSAGDAGLKLAAAVSGALINCRYADRFELAGQITH